MKRWLAVLLFASFPVFAAPFLVADVPDLNADTCVYTTNAGAVVASPVVVDAVIGLPVNSNRICKVDLVASPLGTNNIKLRLRTGSGLWGDSADVPFSFVRPASTSTPAGMRLVP
jgi:hypothetical protein